MRHLIVILFFCAITQFGRAYDKADLLVGYINTFHNPENDSIETARMSLLANAGQSKYFNDISLWNDSLSSTPEGKRRLQQIIMAACVTELPGGGVSIDMRKGPVKKTYTYVYNNFVDRHLSVYDKFGQEQGFYTEPADEMQWEIQDSTAIIMGYECVSAKTDYHGRRWMAWFCPEIPVPAGPWKLRGLPGLILKAESDNDVRFLADGLQQTDRDITPIYSKENYSKVNRKKALAEDEYFRNNRESIIQAQHKGSVTFSYNPDDRPKYDAKKYSLEPDYQE